MKPISHEFSGTRFATFCDPAVVDLDRLNQWITARGGELSALDCVAVESSQNRPLSLIANQILTGEVDVVVFSTSAGLNYLIETASRSVNQQRLVDSLSDIRSVAGSPRVASAFRAHGIEPTVVVNQAISWRDLLIAIDASIPVANRNVGLEVSGAFHELRAGIEARGGFVIPIPGCQDLALKDSTRAQSCLQQLTSNTNDALLFTHPEDLHRCEFLTKQLGHPGLLSQLADHHAIMAIGAETGEILADRNIPVDIETESSDLASAIEQLAARMTDMNQRQQKIHSALSGPTSSSADPNAPWYDNPFMKACRGERTEVTPIWMMRQAGRYMQEYREVRAKVSFLELCANPQLCSEVMCTAVGRLGVDAAIIFSDLLPILVPMGMDLEFVKGDGPVIHNPIRNPGDVDRVKPLESNDELQFVMETVTQTRNDLPADLPLIGFAGAPFTLASYMIEGGASRNYADTKKLMFTDPVAWDQLMQHLVTSISIYLNGQVEAGAQCLQLFDSWAGCLGFEDYKTFVHPYVKQIIANIPEHVPVINFATGNPALLPLLADTQASVIGIDWRIRLDDAWQTVGFDRAVQGNLDPTVLLTSPAEIRRQAKIILDQAAGRAGHIFNLGHGILPQTPVENAIALVDAVHELSSAR